MKLRYHLIINSQSNEVKLRKNPQAGFGEFCVKLLIEIPDDNMPTYELAIPVPASQGIKIEQAGMEFGIPWAIAEEIIEVKCLDTEGKVEWDYTDAGLRRLIEESKQQGCREWWDCQEFAQKRWGLPRLWIEPGRWEPLLKEHL